MADRTGSTSQQRLPARCIAIKSGRNADDRRVSVPSENIIVRRRRMYEGQGGVVENVFMRRVEVGAVRDAVVRVNFFYEEGSGGLHLPVVRNIWIEHVTSRRSPYALFLASYARSPVRDVHLRACRFEGVERPSVVHDVVGLDLDGAVQNSDGAFAKGIAIEDSRDPRPSACDGTTRVIADRMRFVAPTQCNERHAAKVACALVVCAGLKSRCASSASGIASRARKGTRMSGHSRP